MLMKHMAQRRLALAVTLGAGIFGFTTGQPGVVLDLGDDQAWTNCGFMGHPELQTPKCLTEDAWLEV